MFDSLKNQWRLFRRDRPGRRFTRFNQRHRERARGGAQKPLVLMAGSLLVLTGIVMIVFPGPGVLVALIGLALLASESRWLAVVLDKLEVKLRRVAAPLVQRWRTRGHGFMWRKLRIRE